MIKGLVQLGGRNRIGITDAADLDIAVLVGALRHVLGRQVRDGGQLGAQHGALGGLFLSQSGHLGFQSLDLGHQGACLGLILASLGRADQF